MPDPVIKTDFTECNSYITSLLPSIESYQNDYIKSHIYYFQGLKTNSITPTSVQSADCLDQKPQSKETTWVDTNLIKIGYPFSIEIHEYLAPGNNRGWQVIFHNSDGQHDYVRSIGYGIESKLRTYDWTIVEVPTI